MKLGQLRGAIRKSNKAPFVRVTLGPGIPEISLVLQKNPLYEALDRAFPDGKGQETGLTFDPENGLLSVEGGAIRPWPGAVSLGQPSSEELDELLPSADEDDLLV